MKDRRKRVVKRLSIEELERRTMLANGQPEIAMAATGLTNNSLEDFYKAQVGTEVGGPAGVYMVDQHIGPLPVSFVPVTSVAALRRGTEGFDATSGLGQITLTTGANTPGIGSFATPTAGPSRAGGTGNVQQMPALASGKAARQTDAALRALAQEEPETGPASRSDLEQVSQREVPETRTGRRAFSHEGDAEAER